MCPFVNLAQDCAASFAPRQLLKGDGLRKNGRLSDLFGVAEEALLGLESSPERRIIQAKLGSCGITTLAYGEAFELMLVNAQRADLGIGRMSRRSGLLKRGILRRRMK